MADGLGLNAMLRLRSPGNITVLMYHGITSDDAPIDAWTMVRVGDFRRQMQHLRAHCDVVCLGDPQSFVARDVVPRNNRRRKVAITFDDGYRSNYQYAYPVLRELGLPATIFVATGFISTASVFWYDKVICALQIGHRRRLSLLDQGLGEFQLSTGDEERRWADIQAVLTAMKCLKPEAREALATRIASDCGVKPQAFEAFAGLTPEDIAAMGADRLISFGSHTHGHEILTQLSASAARETIERSLGELRRLLGRECELFSYPNGDFNPQLVAMLKNVGVRNAFTVEKGVWSEGTDPLAIPRLSVGGYDSPGKFAALVSGLSLLR